MSEALEKELEMLRGELERVRHILQGNGQPGLVRSLENLSTRLESIERSYVSDSEFKPIRMIIYGGVGMTLTAIGAALIAVILK